MPNFTVSSGYECIYSGGCILGNYAVGNDLGANHANSKQHKDTEKFLSGMRERKKNAIVCCESENDCSNCTDSKTFEYGNIWKVLRQQLMQQFLFLENLQFFNPKRGNILEMIAIHCNGFGRVRKYCNDYYDADRKMHPDRQRQQGFVIWACKWAPTLHLPADRQKSPTEPGARGTKKWTYGGDKCFF